MICHNSPASPALDRCFVAREEMGVYDLFLVLFISDEEKNCLRGAIRIARFINKYTTEIAAA